MIKTNASKHRLQTFLLIGYPLIFFAYTIYSFAYTDPNQVFFSIPLYWNFQKSMWQLGYHQRPLSAFLFFALVTLLFTVYLKLLTFFRERQLKLKNVVITSLVIAALLMPANPALSHDIYNYIFNAKMVLVYHANPHKQVALDFQFDPWVRFMHNTHTTAPYGYGWTILSLIPSAIGLQKLTLTLLLFKLFVGIFFVWLIHLQKTLSPMVNSTQWQEELAAFILNPLVLIETFGNGHNDVVMMALALGCIMAIIRAHRYRSITWWLIAAIFFVASVSIKFATITMLGGLIGYLLLKKMSRPLSLGTVQATALFTPLLTARSQRFHPWYLIWSLTFLPLMKENLAKKLLLTFSFSSLLGYLPFLYYGQYSPQVLVARTIITFSLGIGFWLIAIMGSRITTFFKAKNRK